MNAAAPKLVGQAEAARFLGVSKKLLSVWTCRKLVPHVRITPRCPLYDLDELAAWVEARRVPAGGAK